MAAIFNRSIIIVVSFKYDINSGKLHYYDECYRNLTSVLHSVF